jgi:DNA polymerase-3 subunit beta
VLSRLVDSAFPDYAGIVPLERSRRLTVRRKDFLRAIRAVAPIARHSSQMVRLDIGPTEMRVWAESREDGLSESFVSVKLDGEPINAAFNGAYLLDYLGVISSAEVVVEMTEPTRPAVLRPASGTGSLYVVMPMIPVDEEV